MAAKKKSEVMVGLYIMIPESLRERLKRNAAKSEQTMREYCAALLKRPERPA